MGRVEYEPWRGGVGRKWAIMAYRGIGIAHLARTAASHAWRGIASRVVRAPRRCIKRARASKRQAPGERAKRHSDGRQNRLARGSDVLEMT